MFFSVKKIYALTAILFNSIFIFSIGAFRFSAFKRAFLYSFIALSFSPICKNNLAKMQCKSAKSGWFSTARDIFSIASLT